MTGPHECHDEGWYFAGGSELDLVELGERVTTEFLYQRVLSDLVTKSGWSGGQFVGSIIDARQGFAV